MKIFARLFIIVALLAVPMIVRAQGEQSGGADDLLIEDGMDTPASAPVPAPAAQTETPKAEKSAKHAQKSKKATTKKVVKKAKPAKSKKSVKKAKAGKKVANKKHKAKDY